MVKPCQIQFTMCNGTHGHVEVMAEGPLDALCIWLDTLKETPARRALAKLLEPAEVVQ